MRFLQKKDRSLLSPEFIVSGRNKKPFRAAKLISYLKLRVDLSGFRTQQIISYLCSDANYNRTLMKKFFSTVYKITIPFLVLYLLVLPNSILCQQETDYFQSDFLRYEDYTYDSNIHTVLLYKAGFELSYPILQFGTDDQLILEFDDFSDEEKYLKYTLIHCSANWTPSDLDPSQYLERYYEDDLTDYSYSRNTLQSFIHYRLAFPGEDVRPTISGNYLLKVYPEETPEQPLLTRRLYITENRVRIQPQIKRPAIVADRNDKQEIDFVIETPQLAIANPYQSIKVTILQNYRSDNSITDLKPSAVVGNRLEYDFEQENVFDGGSEFRAFDIKDLQYQTMRIHHFEHEANRVHVHLWSDNRRPFQAYRSDKDINGKRLIKSDIATESAREADYAWVYFTLPYPRPLTDGNLYVFGGLTDWQFLPQARMEYNYEKQEYQAALYLKQGYYNYQYLFLKNNSTRGEVSLVEGNHFECENDYHFMVYYREPGEVYDRLIGLRTINTLKR